jgi:hypothetical protein
MTALHGKQHPAARYCAAMSERRNALRLTQPIEQGTRIAFWALSRVRGKRIFHPYGIGFRASLRIGSVRKTGANLFRPDARYEATVRLSRAIGLPDRVPDILGLSIRLHAAHGPGSDQDFLLVSSARSVGARHALLPAPRGFFGHFFSTVLPYRIGEQIQLIGFLPEPIRPSPYALNEIRPVAAGAELALCVATLTGGWDALGTLKLNSELPHEEVEALRFNPWNTGGGVRPLGPLMGLRDPAYVGSQAGRSGQALEAASLSE